jgi:hypothetical protein
MELDQGAKYTKARRIEIWEEAHRSTIGWLFQNGHIEIK